MELTHETNVKIILPGNLRQTMIEHCRRKASGTFLPGETEEYKAFGLLAGETVGEHIVVKLCLPLMKNARSVAPFRQFMDKMLQEHAIPSKTPIHKRGWVADPEELQRKTEQCREEKMRLLGTYHTHLVAWQNDQVRDTPTKLDEALARRSRMVTFVVSMVNPDHPIIRAFYEGDINREIAVIVDPRENASTNDANQACCS